MSSDFELIRRVLKVIPEPVLSVELPRSWRERLFTRPWRPWLNGVVYQGQTIVTNWHSDDDSRGITLAGKGDLTERLVRL